VSEYYVVTNAGDLIKVFNFVCVVFQRIVLQLLDNVYNNLQFENREGDSHLDLLNRAMVTSWACRLDHEFCVWNAKNKYRQWMLQNHKEWETGLYVANIRASVSILPSHTLGL
jgi:hypothetical protein